MKTKKKDPEQSIHYTHKLKVRPAHETPESAQSDNSDMLYGVGISDLMRVTGCGESTAKRWKSGGSIPEPAKRLIQLCVQGDLGKIHKAWRGWRIKNGQLVSPNEDPFTPGEVQAIPFRVRQLESYKSEQRLPRQADFIEERWTPAPDWSEHESQ